MNDENEKIIPLPKKDDDDDDIFYAYDDDDLDDTLPVIDW